MSIRSSWFIVLFRSSILSVFLLLSITEKGCWNPQIWLWICLLLLFFYLSYSKKLGVTGLEVSFWTRNKVQISNKKRSDLDSQSLCSMGLCRVLEPTYLTATEQTMITALWFRHPYLFQSRSQAEQLMLKETLKRSLWVWPSSYMNHHSNFIP